MSPTEGNFAALADDLPLLVVDDEEQIRRILKRTLEKQGFRCHLAKSADEAKETLAATPFALVLSDVNMPGESGIELIKAIVRDYPDTATLMCTGIDDPNIANVALEIGAYGYVVKPFEANEILIAVMNALRRRSLEIENRDHRDHLEQMVKARTTDLWTAISELEHAQKEIRLSREETIQRLSIAAEFRDQETASHIKRMSLYCALVAERLGTEPQRCEMIRLSSVMHDVGKIGIPDHILLKPGPLDPEEWKIMRTHPEIGYRILSNSRSELMNEAAMIALTHHERIDGTGYPRGLVEDDIPLVGRIAAVADVFDALTTNRVYRKAYSLGEALEIMREGRGQHFDPEILDLFMSSMDRVLGIKEKHADGEQSLTGA
ncbi:MAG: response regulator [Actinomycetota bacterium]